MINNKHLLITSLTFLGLTTISGTLLVSSSVSADNDSVVDEININVPVSCTLSGNGMNTHNAEIPNGTYNSAIGETTLKAFCNDNEGFAIYAIGYTDNEDGKNVLTNSTLDSDYDIVTGTATSGNTSNWAMKLSTISSPTPTYPIIIAGTNEDTLKEQGDPDYTSFQEVPDDYTKVAYRTSSTDIGTNAEGSTLKTTYQAYISQTQAAGTYTGQVKYTMVHPHDGDAPTKPISYTDEIDCPAGYICYSPAANGVEGIMNVQDVGSYAADTESIIGYRSVSSNTTTTLIAPNFKRTGYGFAGWNTELDGTGTNYGPNEDITTPDLSENGLALYAKWIPSSGNLQGWTGCSTMSTNQVIALTDTRDNDTYAVAKLADGNCWMIENLRLDNSMTGTINSSNTDNPAPTFTALPASTDNWCNQDTSACTDQIVLNNNNTNLGGTNASGIALENSQGGGYYDDWDAEYYYYHGGQGNKFSWYSYGNYYNWYTATAGNGTYSTARGSIITGSICPNGWSLPTSYNIGYTYPANYVKAGSWYYNYSYQSTIAHDRGILSALYSATKSYGSISGRPIRCLIVN